MNDQLTLKKMIVKILIFIGFIFLTCCLNNSKKEIVAKYNNGNVYFYEIIDEYNGLTDEKKKELITQDDFFRFVRRIALEKIILERSYKDGLDKKDDIVKKLENIKKSIAFDILIKKNISSKVIVDDKDFNKYKKNFELYQIVKRIDAQDNSKNQQNKNLLEKLSKEIRDLSSFKENARTYSDDITANEGGYVGFIRLGVMEKEIDKVLERLDLKKVSNLVETSGSYHLLFVNKIEEVSLNELYKDKELYNSIYNEKSGKLEEEWYKNLLNNSSLIINKDVIKEVKNDDVIVIKYKDKFVTRKEFFNTVDKYKQESFPEPTFDDMVSLAKNIGLNLILQDLTMTKSIINSREFKKQFNKETDFLLINEYIQLHLEKLDISEEKIREFYDKNKKVLFTFILDNGKAYLQPLDEVRDFIKQKLDETIIQEARYNLYRKLVDEYKLEINNDVLKKIKAQVEKK